jgi:hypothetical protein
MRWVLNAANTALLVRSCSMKSPPASLPENPASVAASNIRLTSSKSPASISVRGSYRRS